MLFFNAGFNLLPEPHSFTSEWFGVANLLFFGRFS